MQVITYNTKKVSTAHLASTKQYQLDVKDETFVQEIIRFQEDETLVNSHEPKLQHSFNR